MAAHTVDPKDALIAWAYRFFWLHAGQPNPDNPEMVAFPSAVIEYFKACERVLPNVQQLGETLPFHADGIGEVLQ